MSDVPPRLLRDALRRTAAAPASSSCIDATTLAAWSDGALPASSRAALESHAANCERCQALIAAMMRTAPPAPRQRQWLPSVGWLVPVAAAVTALVLWIAVPERRPAQPAPAAMENAASQVGQTAAAATSPSSPTSGDAGAQRDAASPERTETRPLARPGIGSGAMRAEQRRPVGADARESALPPAAAGSTSDPTSLQAQRLTDAAAPRATLNSTLARAALQEAAKAAAGVEVVSPDPAVRWRITGTRVERSSDGGTTWQIQSTGVSAALTSGAAPLPTVCWIVGAAGTVMLSVDGRTWQRVAFPDPIDLRAVRASDAAHAVVTAVDGRTFATLDGGRTWQPGGAR